MTTASSLKAAFVMALPFLETLRGAGDEPIGTSSSHLCLLAGEAIARENLPVDKTARWLGFIEGVLIFRGTPLPFGIQGDDVGAAGHDDIVPPQVTEACREVLRGLTPLWMGHEAARRIAAETLAENGMGGLATSRNLGKVQGFLSASGELSMDAERDRTRPIFHEAYRAAGIMIPESVDVRRQ